MKRKQNISNLIKTVFLLLMGIQVFLGCLWICKNLGSIPRFGESAWLIRASEDWILDEYIGILYPLLIRMTSLTEKVTGITFCTVLYLMQLLFAFTAYIYFLKKAGFQPQEKKDWKIYLLAAYVLTFPPILQCHMSVLPYSTVSSVVLLLITELKQLLTNTERSFRSSLIKVSIYWLVSALLLPDYSYIAGILVAAGFCILGWKQREKILILLMTVIVTIAGLGITFNLSQTPGSLNRIQKSVGAVMLSRFTWPYFERNSFFWPDEVTSLFDAQELSWISLYPENVIYEFGPKLEEAVGRKEANEIYWEMAVTSAGIGKKEAFSAFGRDLTANLTGPVSMQLQLRGMGISYTGWNYECMKENSPILTRYFVSFAMYSFDFLLLVSVIMWFMSKKRKEAGANRSFTVILTLAVVLTAVWYTMIGNGMQDYMKIILINILWCMSLAHTFDKLSKVKEDV